MVRVRRFGRIVLGVAGVVVVALANGWSTAVQADGPTLDRLKADYEWYGLPWPGTDAELVIRRTGGNSVVNGVPQYTDELVLLDSRDGKTVHWVGALTEEPHGKILERTREPGAELVQRSTPARLQRASIQLDVQNELLLAIHCQARGWTRLADALLTRSRTKPRDVFGENRYQRPSDDRAALAHAAWAYWSDQFVRVSDDRELIVRHLKTLSKTPYGLAGPRHINLIADMQLTLAPIDPPREGLEGAVDSLISLGSGADPRQWHPPTIQSTRGRHAGYRRLRDAGLEAVPVLLDHLDDFRLTRCIENSRRGHYHARVADVVAQLLNDLATEKFAYDFLLAEGRGQRLDRAHVLHWWTHVQGADALDYLKQHAFSGDEGKLSANGSILKAIGQQYPDELVRLFGEKLPHLVYAGPLFAAFDDSRVSNEVQASLFLDAAKDPKFSNRCDAIERLLRLKHEQAVPLLVREIEALRERQPRQYWLCDASYLPRLVALAASEHAWRVLQATARQVDIGQRMELISAVGNCATDNERAIAFLAGFLMDEQIRDRSHKPAATPKTRPSDRPDFDDGPYSGPCAGFIWERLAVRDFAAYQLGRALSIEKIVDAGSNDAEWAELRRRVNAKLAERN